MKASINNWILLMVLWAFGLSFKASAQAPLPGLNPAKYRLVSQGEPAPYTGVLTDLPTFRLETKKIELQGALINSQKEEIKDLRAKLSDSNATIEYKEQLIVYQKQLTESCETKAVTTQQSLATVARLYNTAKPRWYESPVFIGALAFAGGTYFGIKIAK